MNENIVSDMINDAINDAINDLRVEFDEKIKALQEALEEIKNLKKK